MQLLALENQTLIARKEAAIAEIEAAIAKEKEFVTKTQIGAGHKSLKLHESYAESEKYVPHFWKTKAESMVWQCPLEFFSISVLSKTKMKSLISGARQWITSTKECGDPASFQHILVSSITKYIGAAELSLSFLSGKCPRRAYYSTLCGVTLVDTHHSADGLVGANKPDVTFYITPPNGIRSPVLAGNLAFFIEIQLDDFDKDHAGDIIKRSEIILNNDPTRVFVLTLWLTRTEISIHRASRNDNAFTHSFSSPQSLLVLEDGRTEAGVGLHILASIFRKPDMWGACPVNFPEDLSTYLKNEQWMVTKYLGSGSSSRVFEISKNTQTNCLKFYREKHDQSISTEIRCLAELQGINGVPTLITSGVSWVITKEVFDQTLVTYKANLVGSFQASLANMLLSSIQDIHRRGWRWSDCRPDNIGILANGRPLLFDFNAAVKLDVLRVSRNLGSRCFCAQRLLREKDEFVQPLPDDDIESLLKTLFPDSERVHTMHIHSIENRLDRAAKWDCQFPLLRTISSGTPALTVLELYIVNNCFAE